MPRRKQSDLAQRLETVIKTLIPQRDTNAEDLGPMMRAIKAVHSATDHTSTTPEDLERQRAAQDHYTEENLLSKGDKETVSLYETLKSEILKLGNVKVVPKKLYIAFKSPKNFTDVVIQKNNLKIYINMNKGTLKDEESKTIDVSDTGHWGNGDYKMYVSDDKELDYAMKLIKQSYDRNKGDKDE